MLLFNSFAHDRLPQITESDSERDSKLLFLILRDYQTISLPAVLKFFVSLFLAPPFNELLVSASLSFDKSRYAAIGHLYTFSYLTLLLIHS
jgi:hypothetical protein